LSGIYEEVKAIHFEGDNYTEEWYETARKIGLPIADNAAAALRFMKSDKNAALFSRYNILTPAEVTARYRIKQSIFVNTVELELRTARNMIRTLYLPACFKYQKELGAMLNQSIQLLGREDSGVETSLVHFRKIGARVQNVINMLHELDQYNEDLPLKDPEDQATFCAETIRPALYALREVMDKLEERVDATHWPLPRYWEMLSVL
jgi:glutamine synthetase